MIINVALVLAGCALLTHIGGQAVRISLLVGVIKVCLVALALVLVGAAVAIYRERRTRKPRALVVIRK